MAAVPDTWRARTPCAHAIICSGTGIGCASIWLCRTHSRGGYAPRFASHTRTFLLSIANAEANALLIPPRTQVCGTGVEVAEPAEFFFGGRGAFFYLICDAEGPGDHGGYDICRLGQQARPQVPVINAGSSPGRVY